MNSDLQKASFGKRLAAWLFDGILVVVLATLFGLILAWLLGYDGYIQTLEAAYAKYEAAYGVSFEVAQEEYLAMDTAARETFDAAFAALTGDDEAMRAYNMIVNLSLVITTMGILLAVLAWEFFIPLWLGNGQTVGKKIFGLCLMRSDSVKVNNLQLFTRTVLGKFALEIMIPVYVVLMLYWGTVHILGLGLVAALLIAQCLCLLISKSNSAIHDLLAGTIVVDINAQRIFRSTDDLIAFQKKVAAEQAARQTY